MEERTGPPSVIVAAARLQRGRLGHLVHRGGGPRRHRRPPSFNGAASVTEAEGPLLQGGGLTDLFREVCTQALSWGGHGSSCSAPSIFRTPCRGCLVLVDSVLHASPALRYLGRRVHYHLSDLGRRVSGVGVASSGCSAELRAGPDHVSRRRVHGGPRLWLAAWVLARFRPNGLRLPSF